MEFARDSGTLPQNVTEPSESLSGLRPEPGRNPPRFDLVDFFIGCKSSFDLVYYTSGVRQSIPKSER